MWSEMFRERGESPRRRGKELRIGLEIGKQPEEKTGSAGSQHEISDAQPLKMEKRNDVEPPKLGMACLGYLGKEGLLSGKEKVREENKVRREKTLLQKSKGSHQLKIRDLLFGI